MLYGHPGAPLLQHLFAAFIQRVAAAALQPVKQALHGLDLLHQRREFRQLSSREFLPAFGSRSVLAKTKEELPDFIERKPGLPRALDDREPLQRTAVVTSLSADALGGRKDSNLFVIAESRGPQAGLPRNRGNG